MRAPCAVRAARSGEALAPGPPDRFLGDVSQEVVFATVNPKRIVLACWASAFCVIEAMSIGSTNIRIDIGLPYSTNCHRADCSMRHSRPARKSRSASQVSPNGLDAGA